MSFYRAVPASIFVLLLLLFLPDSSIAQSIIEDSLWKETSQAISSGNSAEALRLLRLCVPGKVNLPESAILLRNALAAELTRVTAGKPVGELSADQLVEFHKLQREICSLDVADAGDWLLLMKACMAMKGAENLIVSGQAFLDAAKRGLPVAISEDWLKILQRLDSELVRDEQILYRLQIAQIFAGVQPDSKELQRKLADVKMLADAKAVKILRFAELEMALGNLSAARACLDQVRGFDPRYTGLEDHYRKLDLAERIDKIIIKANDALLSRKYDEAKSRAEEIFMLDANNFFARKIIEQIEEERQRPVSSAASDADRLQLRIRRLETQLRKAELEQDLQQVSTCLRELLLLKSDLSEHAQRLAEVEQEIAISRLKADERFVEAEELFRKGDYASLRLFLNRNPGLMNSLEKMLQVWEMRLMVNFASGNLEPARLREAANDINRRAGKSFYASYVLMRLDIADNKLNDARAHYKIALELQPVAAVLRWPGLLLWVHGEGRPFAVVVLIVAFLILIKLIRPFFSWFESTYWWRVAVMARVFPSLAVRSLESCFGTVKDRTDRITLFTLLMQSCYRIGDNNKALLYADNLLELVPCSAAALEMRAKIKNRAAGKTPENKAPDTAEAAGTVPVAEPADERRVVTSGLNRDATAAELPAEDSQDRESGQIDETAAAGQYSEVPPTVDYDAEAVADEPAAQQNLLTAADQIADAVIDEPPAATVAPVYSWPPPASDEEENQQPAGDVGEVMADLFNDFFAEKTPEPLRNQPAESKIEQKRRELFASLDAVQSPEPVSEAWRKCDGSKARSRLFKELD